MNRVREIKGLIRQEILAALDQAAAAGSLTLDSVPAFAVEVPRDKNHGDFAVNVAMLLAKSQGKAPRVIAQMILDQMKVRPDWLVRVEIAGPGFLNFTIEPMYFHAVLPAIAKEDKDYGKSDFGGGHKVQIEFVSANPTGLLHMGNARGAALGDTLGNIMSAAGYEIKREYYINDAGNQIENFGKSLEARYLELLGQTCQFPEEGYHGEDIIETARHIVTAEGDRFLHMESALRREFLIQAGLKEKLDNIRRTLEEFGVIYDVWFSEQSLHDDGEIKDTIQELREKGLLYEKEGALWLKATSFGEEKDEVMVRANGVPTYFAGDIAYHRNKFRRGFDTVINIWGADHHGHVARMKGAMGALGFDPDRLEVILMQLVRLMQGKETVKMSKRSGQYVTLSELMEDVGKDAARFFFVMRSADSQMDFDLELAKSQSSENPVYYVQYAHARIHSLLKMAGPGDREGEADWSLLKEPAELELIRKLADLPEEISQAAKDREPHRMPRYAMDLAALFHGFYTDCRCLVEDPELRKARLGLADATRIVLRNTLALLGVSAPERM
ncbi:MAG: arginine--tRNA ligase [Peptococcaceae bacterium]|nr:arginine--tRNA ligase [Peptococcaceae bacterium]